METDALTASSSACLICGRGAGGQPAIHATPCCGANFCTHCLKSTAAHSGKLFRCPACRDEHGFLAHAKALGVKVLDLTPAYADDADDALMVVVKACSAKRCRSPRGRDFDATDIKPTRSVDLSAWRLLSCLSCGGSAVHAGCSATKLGLVWRCDACGGDGDLPSADVEEEASVPFRRRDKVEARFRGGPRWYRGVIVGGNAEDGYRVRYDDDGLIETVSNLVRIRRPAPPPEPAARRVPPPEPAAYEEDQATVESAPSSPEQEPRRKPQDAEMLPREVVDGNAVPAAPLPQQQAMMQQQMMIYQQQMYGQQTTYLQQQQQRKSPSSFFYGAPCPAPLELANPADPATWPKGVDVRLPRFVLEFELPQMKTMRDAADVYFRGAPAIRDLDAFYGSKVRGGNYATGHSWHSEVTRGDSRKLETKLAKFNGIFAYLHQHGESKVDYLQSRVEAQFPGRPPRAVQLHWLAKSLRVELVPDVFEKNRKRAIRGAESRRAKKRASAGDDPD